jgi:hypothetical protein
MLFEYYSGLVPVLEPKWAFCQPVYENVTAAAIRPPAFSFWAALLSAICVLIPLTFADQSDTDPLIEHGIGVEKLGHFCGFLNNKGKNPGEPALIKHSEEF